MTTVPVPARHRSAVEQLIIDQAVIWQDRYSRTQAMPRGDTLDATDRDAELWRAHAASLVEGWTVLYLLGLLRTHAPRVADAAAHALNVSPGIPGEQLPLFVDVWARAVDEGRSLLGLLP